MRGGRSAGSQNAPSNASDPASSGSVGKPIWKVRSSRRTPSTAMPSPVTSNSGIVVFDVEKSPSMCSVLTVPFGAMRSFSSRTSIVNSWPSLDWAVATTSENMMCSISVG